MDILFTTSESPTKSVDLSVSADTQDLFFKYILIGDSAVGKTSILTRFVKKRFLSDYKVTVGAEFGSRTICIDDDVQVKLQIWDTAGQESFQSLVKSFYRGCMAIFVVYNVNLRQTFEDLNGWLQDIKDYADENAILVLIGNQVDTPKMRQVSYQEGLDFMNQNNFHFFFETSALDGTNIELAFVETSKLAYLTFLRYRLDTKMKDTINLSQDGGENGCIKPGGCAC